jgi:competence protein ComEA
VGRGDGWNRLLELVATHWRSLAGGLFATIGLGVAAISLWPRSSPPPPLTIQTRSPTPSPAPPLLVHVVGAVNRDGVYTLPPGARVSDAVDAAGGLAPDADSASINLAGRVVDGQQLVVRSRVASPNASAAGAESTRRLSLNAASAAELETLPGIGPALAGRIVDRRQRVGAFQSLEQLREERLVPASTFERIRDLLTID